MSLLNAARAEVIKLRSTPAAYWIAALFVLLGCVIGWGVAKLGILTASPEVPVPVAPFLLLGPIGQVGIYILFVHAVIGVTGEYRYGTQSTSALATPRRVNLALGKVLTHGIGAALLTLVGVLLTLVLGSTIRGQGVIPLDWGDAEVLRALWVFPVGVFCLVLFGQGIGWLLRNTGGAVALALLWPMALEQVVSMVPKIGGKIFHWLPFGHLQAFMSGHNTASMMGFGESLPVEWSQPETWPVEASGAYFALWAVVIFALGVTVLSRRDA